MEVFGLCEGNLAISHAEKRRAIQAAGAAQTNVWRKERKSSLGQLKALLPNPGRPTLGDI